MGLKIERTPSLHNTTSHRNYTTSVTDACIFINSPSKSTTHTELVTKFLMSIDTYL